MNLDDLKNEWGVDSDIDETKLSHASLSTAKLHSKYLNLLVDSKQKLIRRKYAFTSLRKLKTRYYKGELSKEELEENGWDQWQYNKPLKSEMSEILDGDAEIMIEKVKIEHIETIIYFLESVLGSLRNRGFDIKNAISWNQYLSGN